MFRITFYSFKTNTRLIGACMFLVTIFHFSPTALKAQWLQTDSGIVGGNIECVVTDGTALYAGTSGGGIFKSTNNGTTWTLASTGLTNNDVRSMTLEGTTLFAGTNGGGVFKSTNGGALWSAVNNGLTNLNIRSLRTIGTGIIAGTTNNAFTSNDGGATWNAATGLASSVAVMCFTSSGSNLFAGVGTDVYKSTDNGSSWTLNPGISLNITDMTTLGSRIFLSNTSFPQLLTSGDNGDTWTTTGNTGSSNTYSLAASGTLLLAGTATGVILSDNESNNWTTTGFPSATVISLAVIGSRVFAGTIGAGLWSRPIDELIPTISSVTPTSGAEGTSVIISGTNFSSTPSTNLVYFNGELANVTASTTSSITAIVPSAATTGKITISLAGAATVTSSFDFTVPPTVTGFSPTTGLAGTVVTITGTNFSPTTSNNTVLFGGIPGTVTASTATTITATVPASAETGPIQVYVNATSATSATQFVVISPPTISSVSPASGPTGTSVTITGNHFSITPSNNVVAFNGTAAIVTAATATTISTTVPTGATTGLVTVTVNSLTATSPSSFTILTPPNISSFAPASGPAGTSVNITGNNFSTTPSNNSVTIGGVSAVVTAASTTGLTVVVPPGATTGSVAVTVNSMTAVSSTNFTVTAPPIITGFNPTAGVAGTTVTISGSNFSLNTSSNIVSFNGTPAVVTNSTTTTITTTVPTGASTGTISLIIGTLSTTSATGFSVLVPPTITSFSPTSGPVGSLVTVTGTGFSTLATANTVLIGGLQASVIQSTATSITAAVPVGASSGIAIQVSVNNLTAMSSSTFAVTAPPTISSFSPGMGSIGETVTINGANFSTTTGNNIVKFNGTTAPVITATTSSLTTQIPVGATTGPISVTVNDLTATSSSSFTVLQPPTIVNFSPSSGPTGTVVTIAGTNFATTLAANAVYFNGVQATIITSTENKLTVSVPATAQTGAIRVVVNGQSVTSLTNFTVLIPPTITNITPMSGAIGAIVTIEGANFSTTPSNNMVHFNGTNATVTSSSATTLTTVVPSGATTGRISVMVNSFTVTSPSDFTVLDPTPPTIENKTASSYLQKESVRIVASFLDPESGIASATLRYRFISAGDSFLSVSLAPESGSDYSYTIAANPNETLGVEYEFVCTNGAGLTKSSPAYTTRTSVSDKGVEIPYESPGTSISNYRIVAVPLELSANSVASVFDELGPVDDTRWRLSYFDNGVNRELTSTSSIVPGKGYWLIAKDDPGTIHSGAGIAVTATSSAPFVLNLASGWNQIGNPFSFNIRWSDVQQANPGLSGLRLYDGTFKDGSVLNKMEGGFVFSSSASTIMLPAEKNSSVNNGRQIDFNNNQNALSDANWQVYFSVKKGGMENRIAGFGMNKKASDEVDPFDGIAMPHFFQQWLDVHHRGQRPDGIVVTKDIVPTRKNHTWEFIVEASDPDGTVVLEWDNSYFGEGGPEIFLWDYVANRKVDMRREKRFESNSGKSNLFKVVFGTEDYVKRETIAPTITLSAWPNPVQRAGNVTVGLSIPEILDRTLVTIRVVNVLGQTVWERTREVMPGEHEETWTLSGNENPGVYLVTVTAGKQKRTVRIAIQ